MNFLSNAKSFSKVLALTLSKIFLGAFLIFSFLYVQSYIEIKSGNETHMKSK